MKLKKYYALIMLHACLLSQSFAESIDVKLDRAIALSANYLTQQVMPTGQMIYRQHRQGKLYKQHRYNLLRHAGVIYSLGQYYDEHPYEETAKAIIHTAAWLDSCCYQTLMDWEDAAAIWSTPDITGNNKKPLQAKLGASGLGLVAFVELHKLQPEKMPLEKLRRLARFIVYMQKENGAFYSKYIPSKNGRDDSWTSLYYPGEAALGLIRLAQIDDNPLWLQSAVKALHYLAISRRNSSKIPADHWALIATTELFHFRENKLLPSNYSKLIGSQQSTLLQEHVFQLVTTILNEELFSENTLDIKKYLKSDGRTTPVATRLEGLLAARPIIKMSYPKMVSRLDRALEGGIKFLLNAQVTSVPYQGAMPRSVSVNDSRSGELRIDYTQHALSAWLLYRTLN